MIENVIGAIACIFGAEVVAGLALILWIIWKEYRRR
jgi:hypothetical protein